MTVNTCLFETNINLVKLQSTCTNKESACYEDEAKDEEAIDKGHEQIRADKEGKDHEGADWHQETAAEGDYWEENRQVHANKH